MTRAKELLTKLKRLYQAEKDFPQDERAVAIIHEFLRKEFQEGYSEARDN